MDENEEDYFGAEEDSSEPERYNKKQVEIQKLFSEIERRAKKSMEYLVMEGFIEKTSSPGVYTYTPEGLVLAQQQYKKLKEEGPL
jgi:predicted transcriptional regulator